MSRFETTLRLFAGALLIVACGGAGVDDDGSPDGPWRAETDTLSDTIVVRTVAGSEWGRAHLVEELRVGRIEGADHEIFGEITALAVTPDGQMLIYDNHANALRRYGADGGYRGTIGGAGSGPGEYRTVAGMAVLEDGRIVVNDFGNGRFNVYSAAGDLRSTWQVNPAIAERRPVYVHPDGGVFLHDRNIADEGMSHDDVLVRLDDDGVPVDTTFVIPNADHEPPILEVRSEQVSFGTAVPFSAIGGWSITTQGELVTMVGDRYAVDVHRLDGSVLRVARAIQPVPVSAEERAAEEERITARFRRVVVGWRWDGPPIPGTKPPIGWIHAGRDGSIWVRVAQPGSAIPEAERDPGARTFVREPVVFDVFKSDGRFLGQVRAPDGLQLQPYPVCDQDRVWAVLHDENGVNFVARFRIVRV